MVVNRLCDTKIRTPNISLEKFLLNKRKKKNNDGGDETWTIRFNETKQNKIEETSQKNKNTHT
jgi:hypothetical protein